MRDLDLRSNAVVSSALERLERLQTSPQVQRIVSSLSSLRSSIQALGSLAKTSLEVAGTSTGFTDREPRPTLIQPFDAEALLYPSALAVAELEAPPPTTTTASSSSWPASHNNSGPNRCVPRGSDPPLPSGRRQENAKSSLDVDRTLASERVRAPSRGQLLRYRAQSPAVCALFRARHAGATPALAALESQGIDTSRWHREAKRLELPTSAYVGVLCGWGEGVGLDVGGALFRLAALSGTTFTAHAFGSRVAGNVFLQERTQAGQAVLVHTGAHMQMVFETRGDPASDSFTIARHDPGAAARGRSLVDDTTRVLAWRGLGAYTFDGVARAQQAVARTDWRSVFAHLATLTEHEPPGGVDAGLYTGDVALMAQHARAHRAAVIDNRARSAARHGYDDVAAGLADAASLSIAASEMYRCDVDVSALQQVEARYAAALRRAAAAMPSSA